MMRGCFFIAVAFAMALLINSPVSANVIVNGDFETVTAGTPYDTFDGWTYGWLDTTDGSIMPSTDSVISGDRSVKIGFNANNYHGALSQNVTTGFTWHAELDFAILTGTTRVVGVSILCAAPSTTDDKERITLKTDGAKLYYTDSNVSGGWVDAGLSDALETTGSVWAGQTPTGNHLAIDGYFDAATPYYTLTLNGETSDPITAWQYGTGVVESGSTVYNFGILAAWDGDGGGGDLNCWLADNVSVVSVPEPTTIMLLISSVMLFCVIGKRHRQ